MPLNNTDSASVQAMLAALLEQQQMQQMQAEQNKINAQPIENFVASEVQQQAAPVMPEAPVQDDMQSQLAALMGANTALPSESPENKQRLQEVLAQQRKVTETTQALAADGEQAKQSIQASAEQAKELNKTRIAIKTEGLTLYQRKQLESAENLKDDMIRLNGINDTESQTLYNQAIQNKERADKYSSEQSAILSDPNASVFAKIGASFKQFAFGKPEQEQAHNTLATIRADRLASVQDYYNAEVITSKSFDINNAADLANLKVREESTNNLMAMHKDNIALDSKVISSLQASMGLQGSVSSQLNAELNTLSKIDQFNKDAVNHAIYKAQTSQAIANLKKQEDEAKSLDDYYKRNEETFKEFADTNRDPTLSGLTFKEFVNQQRAIEVKTGRPTRAMESFAVYASNVSNPSDKPATSLYNQYISGAFDPNDPAIKEQTRVDLALMDKAIAIRNAEITVANESASPDKQQPLISMNSMSAEQAASLDKYMLKERQGLGYDISPLMKGGSLVISDLDGMIKTAQTNQGLQDIMNQVLTAEEMQLINSGEMKDVITLIAPDNPQGSVRSTVESTMLKLLGDTQSSPAQTKAKMQQYANIMAKRSEIERRLAKKRGVPGLKQLPIGAVPLYTTGTMQFRLDDANSWLSLMQNYQVRQATPVGGLGVDFGNVN